MQGDAAEKDGEKRDPLHVCPEATENVFFFDAMTKDGEGDVAEAGQAEGSKKRKVKEIIFVDDDE